MAASNPTGPVGTAATVAADGSYSITLPIATATPIVLTATRPLSTGEVQSLTSVVADKANTTANITTITNVIAALLSPNGNPAQLAAQVQAGTAITQAALTAKTTAVQAVLQAASTALGLTNSNPLTDAFVANGTGYDKLLDSVSAVITPAGASSNIEIALKVQAATDGAQPPTAQFTSNQTAALPALPVVAAANFVAAGTNAKLAQLMADATACYALPLTTRVGTAATGNPAAAVGAASDVTAPVCKGIFFGNNPASYKFNGFLVGRNANNVGSFSGLFRDNSTNQLFDAPAYEYTLPNGDIAISFRSSFSTGLPTTLTNFVRLDPADQKLKLIGNQYRFNGSIQAFMQKREFLTLDQAQWNYYTSGYSMGVDNTGEFSKVEVTAPNGQIITLVPDAAVSFLKIQNKGSTNALRFQWGFVDATKTVSVPEKLTSEAANLAFNTQALTDTEMTAVAAQSAWTYRYFVTGNTTTTPDAVQVYRTRARALSIAELRSRAFPSLSTATINTIVTNASSTTGNVALESTAPVSIAWSVPVGALAPTSSTLFGRYLTGTGTGASATSTAAFTDTLNFAATARSGLLSCSTQSATDTHCAGGTAGGFKPGSTANGLNLNATDTLGRTFASQFNAYLLTITP